MHNQSYLESLRYIIYINCPGFIKHILRSTLHYKKNPWLKNIAFSFSKIKNKNIQEASLSQISKTPLPSLLHYEDRSSMSYSIEARVPFLDYRLVEFMLSLDSEYKIKNGVTKQVLRDGLASILPQKIKERTSKLGFVTIERKWLKKYEDEILELLKQPWPNYINQEKN